MQITKWVAVTLTVCLLGGRAFSQNVDDIISKHIDAMGGKDKLASLQSVYEEVNNSMMGNELPSKVWIANNTGYRMEMDMMGSKMIFAVDKDKGWSINPMGGSTDPQPLPDEAVKTFASRMQLGGVFFNYKDRGYSATLLGQDTVGGKTTYKIKLSKSGEPDATYYIDATTYYIDKASTTTFVNGASAQQDIMFTSYKKTPEGYIFPGGYTMELPMGELVAVINKVVVNQPIDPKLFQNP
jgi:hypothetical protein